MKLGRIEVFKDKKRKWKFRVISSNGKTIAQSKAYSEKRNAIVGAWAVVDAVKIADIVIRE